MCNCIKLLPKIITFKHNHSAKVQQVQQHTAHIFLGFGGAPIVFPHWKQTQMFPGVCWLAGCFSLLAFAKFKDCSLHMIWWRTLHGIFYKVYQASEQMQVEFSWRTHKKSHNLSGKWVWMYVSRHKANALTLTKCSTHSLLLMSPCSWTLWPLLCSLITGPGHIHPEQAPNSLNPM